MANLALLDLVLPYVFRGESLGPSHAALSVLRVVTFETSTDVTGITVRGHCEVNGSLTLDLASGTLAGVADEAAPATDSADESAVFDLRQTTIDFELLVPRVGSAIVSAARGSFGAAAQAAGQLIDDWSAATPADSPSTGFTLDLVLNAPALRPPFLHPAKVSAIGVLEPDPSHAKVAITLPRLRFRLSHGNTNPTQLVLALASAGVSSLDDPGSLSVSEMVSMDPPYAYVGGAEAKVVGFGFRSAVIDLDRDWTPPAISRKTGIGDDWTGLYLPEARLFVSPDGLKNLAFECGAQELLIGFGKSAGLWGDFEAALVQQGTGELTIHPRFGEVGTGRMYGVTPGGVVDHVAQAKAQVPDHTKLIVDVTGGRTPYHRTVKVDGTVVTPQSSMYDVDLTNAPTAAVDVEVTCGSGASALSAKLHIDVTRLRDQPTLTVPGRPTLTDQSAVLENSSGSFTFDLDQGPASAGTSVTVRTDPIEPTLVWTPQGGPAGAPAATFTAEVPAGQSLPLAVTRPGASGPTTLPYYFFWDSPGDRNSSAMSTLPAVSRSADRFPDAAQDPRDAYHQQLADLPNGATITITGDASYENDPSRLEYNTHLAWTRAMAVQRAIDSALPSKNFSFQIVPRLADHPPRPSDQEQADWSTAVGWLSHAAPDDRKHWSAQVTFTGNTPDAQGSVTVRRPNPVATPTTVSVPPADPPPAETSPPPDWFRSVKAMVRVVDSQIIAVQLDLEVDFQTLSERKLGEQLAHQNPTQVPPNTQLPQIHSKPPSTPPPPGENPADGITLFRALVQTDPATGQVDTLLSAGADPADTDGLLHAGWIDGMDPMPPGKDLGLTFLGSYLSFWPLLAAAPPVDAVRDAAEGRDGAVVEVALAGAALAAPGVIAALPWFSIERVVLFGVEYFHTQVNGGFTGTLLIDVEADWSVNLLGLVTIERNHPLKVRYKAIGIRLTNRDVPPDAPPDTAAPDRWDLLPVFDSSRGYTIDIAGGTGGIKFKDPLGKILRIVAARLSKSNPFTMEVEIALGVDLGVVSIESAAIRAYLDGSRPPELTALAAKIDIPGAILARGSLRIATADDGTKTISGQIDVFVRPINLRIAAALAIANIVEQGTGRTATGVYIGLNIVLPVGIPLGATGLGIFGFRGIFGMHYQRTELTDPETNVPALAWLKNAKGQPHRLENEGTVLWAPKIDNWAFGVGILIGTMDGGTIINLDGTFLLELPGPRLVIMLNARILSKMPDSNKMGMSVGILAVIEITPDHFMIGVLVTWQIKDLVKIVIPVEAVFPFGHDANQWHIYLGARRDVGPSVEVDVLGIVKGSGYLMFKGDGLGEYTTHGFTLPALKGFAIGVGVAAAFEWGDRSSGLYLTVGGGMDAEIGFDPFTIAGVIWVAGELRLWVVSVGADAKLFVVVAERPGSDDLSVYIEGQACGHVNLFFFEVSGCVHLKISGPKTEAPFPDLVEKVSLQSRSPALATGTGVDRGIDVSLGQATASESYPGDDHVPVVAIDAIPVISCAVPPAPQGAVTIGGLGTPLEKAGGCEAAGGYAERGGDRYRYWIDAVRLERVNADGSVNPETLTAGDAPARWWTVGDVTSANPSAQLALLTYDVTPATKALQYTEKMVEDVTRRWGTVCEEAAPAAAVLWTFKLEPLGPRATGWNVQGLAWPDPPDTHRGAAVETALHVSEPWRTGDATVDGLRGVVPAYVVAGVVACQRTQKLPGVTGLPRLQQSPRIVRGGRGPVGGFQRSGALLPTDDQVRRLVAPASVTTDLRVSEAFYDKAVTALPGMRAVTAKGSSGYTVTDLLRDTATGTAVPRDVMELGAATTFTHATTDRRTAGDVGSRCIAKALVAPARDYGAATTFRGNAFLDVMKRNGVGDERRERANLLRLHTGGFTSLGVLLLLPLHRKEFFVPVTAVVYRADGVESGRVALQRSDFLVSGAALPAEWTDLQGPWGNDVADLLSYCAQAGLSAAFLDVPADEDAAYVDLGQPFDQDAILKLIAVGDEPAMDTYLLAAMAMVTSVEQRRHDSEQSQRELEKSQFVQAVSSAVSNYALLKSDSRYRVTVDWHAERAANPNNDPDLPGAATLASAAAPKRQIFWFRTDTIAPDPADPTLPQEPGDPVPTPETIQQVFTGRGGDPDAQGVVPVVNIPVRLDPWVMMTIPQEGETGVFFGSRMRLVFNTPDVDRIFAEYGKQLRVRLSAANGQHPDEHPTIDQSTLTVLDAVLKSPWHQAIDTMKATGLVVLQPDGTTSTKAAAPCVQVDAGCGSHSQFEVPLPLNPLMGYLLDVELVPVGAAADARGPRLLRRSFTTGNYAELATLAWSVSHTLPRAAACDPDVFTALLALGGHPQGGDLDAFLHEHHLGPWGPVEQERVTVYWQQTGSQPPQPAAVVLEAREALRRERAYPVLTADPSTPDNAQRWTMAGRAWLDLAADDTSVAGIVWAPGEQRAIVVLEPGCRGRSLTIQLVAPAMPDLPFLDEGGQTADLARVTFDRAPWEEVAE